MKNKRSSGELTASVTKLAIKAKLQLTEVRSIQLYFPENINNEKGEYTGSHKAHLLISKDHFVNHTFTK